MNIEIQEGIPVPVGAASRGNNGKFSPIYNLMAKLTKGQSFAFEPVIEAGLKDPIGNAVYNCRKYGKTLKDTHTFVVKELDENGKKVVRVWATVAPEAAPAEKVEEAKEADKAAEQAPAEEQKEEVPA